MHSSSAGYVGRFAPSPTGPLHFGSLLAALASYLDARSAQGNWLLRIEDIDPGREPPGAADAILDILDTFGLHWDGPVLYQSTRIDAYNQALRQLESAGNTFGCTCSRQKIRDLGGVYDGHCRHRSPPLTRDYALRVRVTASPTGLNDLIQGYYEQNLSTQCGDFILRRRDGLIAYQLAVVVDDAWQGVTHIVRGSDLLESTPRQLWLQSLLNLPRPIYAHIPIASNPDGQKLSKQHHARPLRREEAGTALHQALVFLGQQPPAELNGEQPAQLLDWAVHHWDIQQVPKLANIPVSPQLS